MPNILAMPHNPTSIRTRVEGLSTLNKILTGKIVSEALMGR